MINKTGAVQVGLICTAVIFTFGLARIVARRHIAEGGSFGSSLASGFVQVTS